MIRTARSGWRDVVLVCGKCSKKLDGGFGPKRKRSLAKALRDALGVKGRKAARGVVETKCLGVCPKRAVMVVAGAEPGAWLVVPEGMPVDAVIERLSGAPSRVDPQNPVRAERSRGTLP